MDKLVDMTDAMDFSTYSELTVERLLDCYHLDIPIKDVLYVMKNPNIFCYHLMKAPLSNIFNGIILQQTRDYQSYAQEMFVDYLLSSEGGKDDTMPGADIRHLIGLEKTKLAEFNEQFRSLETEHKNLIAQSQAMLIVKVQQWKKKLHKAALSVYQQLSIEIPDLAEDGITQALAILSIYAKLAEQPRVNEQLWQRIQRLLNQELTENRREFFIKALVTIDHESFKNDDKLTQCCEQILVMNNRIKEFRVIFYDFILHNRELFKSLPEYKANPEGQQNIHRLHFDITLGEEKSKD